jgi:glycosyltransferase involved in cell wall biosynthesis
LPKLRLLCESIRKFHPEFEIYWAIADKIPDWASFEKEPIDGIVRIEDLGIENWQQWAFGLNLIELSTAIKPFAAKYLLDLPDTKGVFYFDPDMVLFSRLDDMVDELKRSSILLTPHQAEPETELDAIIDNEICSLRHGIYNLGYFGISNDEEGRRFLKWWGDRLFRFCHADLDRHLWTDQKWINFAPVFFDRVGTLKSPRFNVAAWNITKRDMKEVAPWKFTINRVPLGFYHFSGFDSGAHKIMATKYAGHNRAVMKLVKWYEKQMKERSEEKYESLPWGFGSFDNGQEITDAHRKIYRERSDLQKNYPDPFATSASHSYEAWFNDRARIEYPQFFGGSPLRPIEQQILSFIPKFLIVRRPKIRFWIDSATVGLFDFFGTGWVASETHEIVAVKILAKTGLFGRAYVIANGVCQLHQPRQDVKAAHPDLRFGENSGFTFQAPLIRSEKARLYGFELTLANGRRVRIRSNLQPVIGVTASRHVADINNEKKRLKAAFGNSRKKSLLVFDHQMGGGANRYCERMIRDRLDSGQSIALVTYNLSAKKYQLQAGCLDGGVNLLFNNISHLFELIADVGFSEIFINNLVSYPSPLDCIERIRNLRQPGTRLTVPVHDFFAACPQWTLIDDKGRYCGVPHVSRCIECMANNRELFTSLVGDRDVPRWRATWEPLLRESSEIICFSSSSKNILMQAYPDLVPGRIKVKPHSVDYIKNAKLTVAASSTPRIAIVGDISPPKGSRVVAEMVGLIKERKLGIKITIIGTISETLDKRIVEVLGPYSPADLPELVRRSGAQLVLLPFVWPETFSYVTQELMQLGLPIAVFDIGAPAERVRNYERGIIISRINATAAIEAVEDFFSHGAKKRPRQGRAR